MREVIKAHRRHVGGNEAELPRPGAPAHCRAPQLEGLFVLFLWLVELRGFLSVSKATGPERQKLFERD